MMQEFCASRWWLFALRGVFGVVFGFLALVMPGVTLATLVLLFGAYSFADGAVSLGGAITGRSGGDDRWITGLQGLLGIIVGLVTLFMPGVTALGLLFAIAAWMLVVGVMQLFGAIRMRQEMEGAGWLALSGLVSIIFAVMIVSSPGSGALAVVWIIGMASMAFGATLVGFAFRLRKKGQAAG